MSFTRFYNFLFYCSVCGPDQAGSSGKEMSAVPTNALDDVKVLSTLPIHRLWHRLCEH
jgi:hypothetical protein